MADRLAIRIRRYGDDESLDELAAYTRRAQDMLDALGSRTVSGDKTRKQAVFTSADISPNLFFLQGIPKALKLALERLTSEDEVNALAAELTSHIEHVGDDEPRVDLSFDGEDIVIDWETGVEELEKKSENELWELLGLQDKRIPFFHAKYDVSQLADPGTPEYDKLLESIPDALPLIPKWHQLVGILKIVKMVVSGEPLLLMDEVGVGKTLQVVGAICTITYYYEVYERTGHFPGMFGE